MGARVLFAGLVVTATVVVAGPAFGKVDIAAADITGPGLKGGLRIENPDTYGLWDSGIDTGEAADDARTGSVWMLGLTPADLGPRYLVTYRFGIGRAVQDLYPFATGGPVTYTPPGQELGRRGNTPDFLSNMPIVPGWYRSPPIFLRYLVEHGMPATDPTPSVDTREHVVVDTATRGETGPLVLIVVALMGLGALERMQRTSGGADAASRVQIPRSSWP